MAQKANAAHEVVFDALTLADRVYWNDKRNAGYVELYYEVVPEALATLMDLVGLVKAERAEGSVA